MIEQKAHEKEKREERLVRILSKDIEGRMKVYTGLTKIKGISWSFSNAVCNSLKIDKNKTIGNLTDEEIKKIESEIERLVKEIDTKKEEIIKVSGHEDIDTTVIKIEIEMLNDELKGKINPPILQVYQCPPRRKPAPGKDLKAAPCAWPADRKAFPAFFSRREATWFPCPLRQ